MIRPNDSERARVEIRAAGSIRDLAGPLPVDKRRKRRRPPPPSPFEEPVLRALDYVEELRERGLSPVDVVMDDLWDDIAKVYGRADLSDARKTEAALAVYDNAWLHPALRGQPKLALVISRLLQAVKFLVAGVGPEAHRAALDLIATFSPGDLPRARRHVLKKLVKDKPTRRRMIELTRHLTERQAAQVLPLSARTIGRARLEDDAKMETETPTSTVVERLTAPEALVELERQVGVLPPDRVEEEVERLLDEVLD